jgi:biotin synthase
MSIIDILLKEELTRQDIIDLLSSKKSEDIELLRTTAEKMLLQQRGSEVYFRGLVEFSNICTCDCFYCGIRKGNANVKRYLLTKEQIVKASLWCADQGYGSVVFQSGERNDDVFIDFVEDVVLTVKEKTKSKTLPNGIGITLCVGEQTENTYQRFYNAGAHRYLLRIESSSPDVFRTIHPVNQTIENRIQCLKSLKKIGYRTGTGVMIGIPGQSIENLADDILFFQEINADMIGMGPYIVHSQTPMAKFEEEIKSRADEIFLQSLKMIAVTRLVLKNVNIAGE